MADMDSVGPTTPRSLVDETGASESLDAVVAAVPVVPRTPPVSAASSSSPAPVSPIAAPVSAPAPCTATTLALPLPQACVEIRDLESQLQRARATLLIFKESPFFDSQDLEAAEAVVRGLAASIQERTAELAMTQELARAVDAADRVNRRHDMVTHMLNEKILDSRDALFEYLVQRQCQLRAQAAAALRHAATQS